MGAREYEDVTLLRRLGVEEQADEAYRDMYEQVEDELRAEWEEQFDSIPYKPNGDEIHRITEARLKTY
jgi:hypothetical protein